MLQCKMEMGHLTTACPTLSGHPTVGPAAVCPAVRGHPTVGPATATACPAGKGHLTVGTATATASRLRIKPPSQQA